LINKHIEKENTEVLKILLASGGYTQELRKAGFPPVLTLKKITRGYMLE